MKLAARICLLVLFCGLVPFASAAQRRLPNGQPIARSTLKAALPTAVVAQEKDTGAKTSSSGPPPALPAPPPAASKPENSSRITLALDAENNVEGKLEFKSDGKIEKKPAPPPPCKDMELAHDWLERADRAATVVRELLDASDRGMPQAMLNRSNCVAVIPSMKKGGLSFGGQWGRGVISCRYDNRSWSPPIFFTLTGGSFGLQIGFQLTDLVMIISTRSGLDSLLNDKVEIGASVGGTALLMGRSAGVSSDVLMDARIFSYARSRGLFVGLELRGAYFRPDAAAHHTLYGKNVHLHDILSSERIPGEANAACFAGVTAFPRALRDISPAKMFYVRVPRPRYQQSFTPSAPTR